MAEKETINEPKDLIEATPEEVEKLDVTKEEGFVKRRIDELDRRERMRKEAEKSHLASWVPKTKLGKSVKEGKEKDLDKILDEGKKILEPEIVDSIITVESDLLLIGQAKGKFGGGKRRAWRQTQKKTMEGNVITFSTMVVVGDRNGHVGLGMGKAKETLPAREKAMRQAKLNIVRINIGFEDPNDALRDSPHTVPFKVKGKCGSVSITLIPAPRGTGLVVADECKKILKLAGIKDVYSKTEGTTRTTFNLARACLDALENTKEMIV